MQLDIIISLPRTDVQNEDLSKDESVADMIRGFGLFLVRFYLARKRNVSRFSFSMEVVITAYI